MKTNAKTVEEYLAQLPDDRRTEIEAIRKVVLKSLPKGYEETLQYGSIAYVVPLKAYPKGYLHRKNEAIAYAAVANQKNYISLYLMSVYAGEGATWFREAYKESGKKLDMGKSCVRFKKVDDLALDVIRQAIARMPMKDYIAMCDSVWSKK